MAKNNTFGRPSSRAPGCVSLPLARRIRVTLLSLLLLSLGLIYAGRHPRAAPSHVQTSGDARVARILSRVATHPDLRSARGQALLAVLHRLRRNGQIVFTCDIPGRGAFLHRPLFGSPRLYVMVLEMNHGRYLHQLDSQIAEVLFHEAIHAHGKEHAQACFEEECDAFAAGALGEAAVLGHRVPEHATMDGRPISQFVRERYPTLATDAEYVPVGMSYDALLRMCGAPEPGGGEA